MPNGELPRFAESHLACRKRSAYTLAGATYQTAQNELTVGTDVLPYGVAGDLFTVRVSLYETSGLQVRLQRIVR